MRSDESQYTENHTCKLRSSIEDIHLLAIDHCLSQCESTCKIQQFKVKFKDSLLNVVMVFVSREKPFVSVAFQKLF